jgi:hypothetical protein
MGLAYGGTMCQPCASRGSSFRCQGGRGGAGRGGAGQKPKADLRLQSRFEISHWQIWFGPETRSEWQKLKWRPHPVCETRRGAGRLGFQSNPYVETYVETSESGRIALGLHISLHLKSPHKLCPWRLMWRPQNQAE